MQLFVPFLLSVGPSSFSSLFWSLIYAANQISQVLGINVLLSGRPNVHCVLLLTGSVAWSRLFAPISLTAMLKSSVRKNTSSQ